MWWRHIADVTPRARAFAHHVGEAPLEECALPVCQADAGAVLELCASFAAGFLARVTEWRSDRLPDEGEVDALLLERYARGRWR